MRISEYIHILSHLVWLSLDQESQLPSLHASLYVTMFQEDGVVPGGFVGSLLAREEAEERRLQVLQDPWESRKHINLGIHLCYNSDILKHQFDIDLETCLRVLRSIHSMISMYSRCCKLLVVALLRVTVRQEDCVDWLRQHGAKDVGLVGHSRGGVTISQLEGDFCRVTWMTWILKAMVLAEFRDPIHPIRIWGEHRWISTTSSRSWRYIQKRSGRTHADHLWCRRRDLYSPSIVDGLCCMDAIELSNLCSTFLKYPRFFKCFECVDLSSFVFWSLVIWRCLFFVRGARNGAQTPTRGRELLPRWRDSFQPAESAGGGIVAKLVAWHGKPVSRWVQDPYNQLWIEKL